MEFFNKLGDTIVNATQEVGEKAKGMTDVAKLQYEMKTKEDFINKQYQEIGKLYYQNNRVSASEEYKELFDEVDAAQTRISEIKDKIAFMKGGKTCPKCGVIVESKAAFCSSCGAKMEEDIFEEEDEVTTETENATEEVETVTGEVVEEVEE